LHLHPTVALSSLIKDLKLASTDFIKKNKLFPKFNGWQVGYAAFTYSVDAKHNLITYVKNQEAHHRLTTSLEELTKLLSEHQVEYNTQYLE
jgi:putative transposase